MPETHSDIGEQTARFQAFKERDDDLPPAWRMKAAGGGIGLLVGVVIAAVVLAVIAGVLLVG
jgi:hypothetical protein